MRDLSPSRNSSLRVFLARQAQQLVLLCIICGVLFFSLHSFTSQPPQLLIQSEKFPRKIWQSWKVDPTRFEHRDNGRARTWTTKNPLHRYEVLTDDNADNYVEHHFGSLGLNRPDIIEVYKSLDAKIIKSDLLRYLIMYVEGGVYADIDVEAIRPVKKFVPKTFNEADIDMVIGIEVDEPDFVSHPVLGSKAQSFCQWTFMCKPRLPVMLRLIENIMKWLHELSLKQGKPISELHLDFDEVLSGTGPSAFTAAILTEMSKTVGEPVVWDRFHELTEPKLVGGVLVLTVEAFAAGTGHSDSGNHGGKGAMVKHHFHASTWTDKHQRKKHAVYGEVEKCNWDMECVKLWDANTALFDSLPEAERLKIIELKELNNAKKADPVVNAVAEAADNTQLEPAAAPAEGMDSHAEAPQDNMAGMVAQVAVAIEQVVEGPESEKSTSDLFMQHTVEGSAAMDPQPELPADNEEAEVEGAVFLADSPSPDLKARDTTLEELPVGLTPGLAL